MKLGLYGINLGACAATETAVAVARAAEECGFESLWTAEHVVLPDPIVPGSPIPAQTPLLDPIVSLAHMAAHTERVRLATGIIILPQRNPVVLAKELASLDVLSGGRLIFGVGAGYLEPEFKAVGASFSDRGERMDEAIDVIRELWTADKPNFAGRHYAFENINAYPRPVQRPCPPIVVGGASPPALRRAQLRGDGWYGFALDPKAAASCLEGLEKAASEVDRDPDRGRLELSVTPVGSVDAEVMARYADLGIDRLILLGMAETAEKMVAFIEQAAESLIRAS